ncbi:MAG: DUF547 domain-containing protein [Luteitalea sp.]|nr:DUF547 domain-containing protein [Luteitalea sp.]
MRLKVEDFRLKAGSLAAILAAALAIAAPHAQQDSEGARRMVFDQILDLNVRDGLVYYRALKSDRGRLDRYVASLATAAVESDPREEQIAFWLNAYNAIVLRTVVDHYPIRQRTRDYPAQSIRQIPGAFEKLPHRVAGRTVTLDQIEQTVLPAFRDPRLFLALGRGAIGSGRLRSEAYTAAELERQLREMASECATRSTCVQIDPSRNTVQISSIFSWRRDDFAGAYADKASPELAARSPIERAAIAFFAPHLLTAERELIAKNQFSVEYLPFDWTLNDLTGRGGR